MSGRNVAQFLSPPIVLQRNAQLTLYPPKVFLNFEIAQLPSFKFLKCSASSLSHTPAMSRRETWSLVYLLFLGQVLSFSLAVNSFTSSLIADHGVDTPLTQSLFAYFFLALVYGAVFLYRRQKLLVPWYWYIVLAIVDVQGNFLIVKAYQYSSITSVTLLDCWTIPWVIVLTWFVLGTRYSLSQFCGAAVCLAGLGLVLLSDSWDSGGGAQKPLLGDALVVIGTLCYAFSNVGEEFCVKMKDRIEVVMMLGAFATVVSACEISILERKDLESVKWSPTMIGLFAGFTAGTFVFYTVAPLVLKMSGSALFNLSLLTSDMWAVVIRLFFYRQKVDWLYYLAFSAVALGLIIYSLNDASRSTTVAIKDGEQNHQSEPLIEANSSPRNDTFNI